MAKSSTPKSTSPAKLSKSAPEAEDKKLVIHKQTLDELSLILEEARMFQSRRVCIA
jgi:hypothetical protein